MQKKMNASDKTAVSLADVAEEAGVSKMTVSRVLRDATGFSESTRVKVTQAIDKLGYVNNKLAVAFNSEKKSTLIGICVPEISSELFSEILEGIESKLSAIGYQAIIGADGYDAHNEEEWLRTILQWRPSGLILINKLHTEKSYALLKARDIPYVEIWRTDSKPTGLCVGFKHFDAGYEMGRYMISRNYQRIAYIGSKLENYTLGKDRIDGFKKALSDHGQTLLSEYYLNDRSSFYSGYYATEHMLTSHPEVDAIYYLDDNMAVGGMMYSQKHGRSIPDDLAIAGFGGMNITSILPQELTTTTAFRRKIGKQAADLLIKSIVGQDDLQHLQDVGFHLVRGDTT